MGAAARKTWRFGSLQLTLSRYAPDTRLEPHCDDRFRISVVMSGQISERCAGNEEYASALSVVAKPGDARHSNRFGPRGARLASVEVPDSLLRECGTPGAGMPAWRWLHCSALAPALSFIRTVNACHGEKPPSTDQVQERVEFLLDTILDTQVPTDRAPPSWLRAVRERIHDTFDRTIPVHELAREANVHPTHLTRWFRNFYGCPVTTYRQRLRLKAATDALTTQNTSLADVAAATGFYDQSHFTHTFKAHTGSTPAAIRWLATRD
ncbi:MAG: AraC family transcriptional regulator [Rhodanobacteraceae bacterium]